VTDLTLYANSNLDSPYAMSAFVALEEKQLPYTLETVDLRHKPGWYAAGHTGRVPALKHGDYWLAESSAIAEYLAETFPFPAHPRIFPEDLKERGLCRMIQAWVRSDFLPIRQERPTSTVFGPRTAKPLSDEAKLHVDRLLSGVEPLIGDRPTLFAQWCIADCDLALMLQRLNLNGDPLPAKVKAYCDAAWQRPSVQKWIQLRRSPRA
jgi:glutathione S-transferase